MIHEAHQRASIVSITNDLGMLGGLREALTRHVEAIGRTLCPIAPVSEGPFLLKSETVRVSDEFAIVGAHNRVLRNQTSSVEALTTPIRGVAEIKRGEVPP